MARIKMKDSTAHGDTGALRAGDVYEVNDDLAAHLIAQGLASKTNAQTTADRNAELADDQPSIEEQAAAAGTKPGDQEENRTPKPLNPPAEKSK